jgi:hypothetical protein
VSQIVIDLPDELKYFGAALLAMVDLVRRGTVPEGKAGRAVDYACVEREVGAAAAEIERRAHQVLLQGLDVDCPAVEIEGVLHTRVGRYPATYYTMPGPVEVTRSIYRPAGQRNAKVVDPVSLRAGVVQGGWLPATARAMAHAVQQQPAREAEQAAQESGRLPYSRSAFEDVCHAVGALHLCRHTDIEEALLSSYPVPEKATSVSVSLDRGSIPMIEPRPRPVGRPRKDAPKNPVERVFHMAYCGTITLHDAAGDALHTIRLGCMPEGDPTQLCDKMAGDVENLLQKRPDLRLVLLCDGAPEMWNLLGDQFNEAALGIAVHRLIDFWHLLEKLGKAAVVIHGASEADAVIRRWRLRLLNASSAAGEILDELRRSGCEQTAVGQERPVHAAITYLENHEGMFDYAKARRRGWPIGSGNVEATVKSLFECRMKRPGAGWKTETGEHIVHLRALALSDRWGPAMELTLRPLARSVRPAA